MSDFCILMEIIERGGDDSSVALTCRLQSDFQEVRMEDIIGIEEG